MIETQCETQCSNLKALEALPAFTSNLIKRLKTAKWTAEENAVWDELRAEFEALRLRIRADLDACRSRKRLEGKGP